MIEVKALTLSIDGKRLLHDVDFALAAGDHLAVVGPNGSGKSTLLRLLTGMLKPTRGTILLGGRPLQDYGKRELARVISYVPQHNGHELPFIVDDFVRMARYPYHTALSDWQPADQQAVEDALSVTDTARFRQRKMATLSGGECQRVMIAAALCQQTPLMVLDEPTSYLDPHHQVEVNRIIRQLNREHGKTIVEVSHDINHASHSSQQVLALKQGKKLWSGAGDAFLQRERLKALYDQDFVFISHPSSGATVALPEQP